MHTYMYLVTDRHGVGRDKLDWIGFVSRGRGRGRGRGGRGATRGRKGREGRGGVWAATTAGYQLRLCDLCGGICGFVATARIVLQEPPSPLVRFWRLLESAAHVGGGT